MFGSRMVVTIMARCLTLSWLTTVGYPGYTRGNQILSICQRDLAIRVERRIE